jgi:hypothetical protein
MTATLNKRLHAVLAANNLTGDKKEYAIYGFTNGRTSSSKDLTDAEVKAFIASLAPLSPPERGETAATSEADAANNKRRKLCGLAHNIGWVVYCPTKGGYKADMPRLYGWVKQYGHLAPKALKDYTSDELNKLITQFKQVQKSELNK